MDRHIVYPGSIPLETDQLNAAKDAYYGVGWLSQSAIGVNTQVVGLAVTPTSPASLQVNVAPGAIYSFQTVDSIPYGSLGTDANQFTAQGISKSTTTLTITPPGTVGQSINYLVQVAFSEPDGTPVILPYYNASNPSVAWSGPNNTGIAQNTVRQNTCVVGLKAGSPAATGSQTTPAPDAGYTGIYVVTVAQGQTTITGGNITALSTAPYFPTLPQIPLAVQASQWTYSPNFGTANAYLVSLGPAPTVVNTGFRFQTKANAVNTGAMTVNVNFLLVYPVVNGDGSPVAPGAVTAGQMLDLIYDGTSFRITNTSVRQRLTGPLNLYVATTGSDSNNGLTSGTAFLTTQRAWNYIQNNLDLNGFVVTVNVATGAGYAGMIGSGFCTGQTSASSIVFLGNPTTPTNVTINATNACCFSAVNGAYFTVAGFQLGATGGGLNQGIGLNAAQSSQIVSQNMSFGGCAVSHTFTSGGSYIFLQGPIAITSSSNSFIYSQFASGVNVTQATITLTGTPNFANAFVNVTAGGLAIGTGASISGAATGKRYSGTLNSIIVAGGSAMFFPGSVAGTVDATSSYG
ncbi:hypothetical protein HB779_02055 [Phyllobacterium sp. 628]|uniref:hypothetical protein n=1 Tax=Phyllobacterium sp. 628 TaxID=2718938 RepID=UPI0016626B3B|nr:hypothetical protein [Phyllobacterium sp. 628]QND50805.1 hypothetical protein HB779_02055 [Phyllobacterium sp. 628]